MTKGIFMPTVQEALDRIWSDASLKSRLLSNPKPVLREFGLQIPDSVSIQIHENTPTLINAVLPIAPPKNTSFAMNAADPVARIIEQAWQDPAFKKKLLSDPKEAAAQSGLRLPESMQVKVWEDTPTVNHLVLPLNPAESELSDADLEAVAGGSLSKGVQTSTGCGAASGAAGIAAAALAFTAIGSAIAGGVSGAAAAGSAIGGAVASGGGKC
jgi:hypothetical protein